MIYTFYSYKGGVGRSMALANIAELFYHDGLKVLMIDWDLEAPGLENFFLDMEPLKKSIKRPGLADMIRDYKEYMAKPTLSEEEEINFSPLPSKNIKKYLLNIHPKKENDGWGKLWLLSAGRRDAAQFEEYTNFVRTFDWLDFYDSWKGNEFFEWLRQQVEKLADVVLIDSRTGLSEMGGVCTYQLANVVVMFSTANRQSLDGVWEMANRLRSLEVMRVRKQDERPLEIMVIPSRVEDRADKEKLESFRTGFLSKFSDSNAWIESRPWLNQNDWGEFLWQHKIPHVPYYAFDEKVVVNDELAIGEDLRKAYVDIAAFLALLAPDNSRLAQFGQGRKSESISYESISLEKISGSEGVIETKRRPFDETLDTRSTITSHRHLASREGFSRLKIFIASPGDVTAERKVTFKVIDDLNEIWGDSKYRVALEPLSWEGSTYSSAGKPQEVIKKQIPIEKLDIFVAVIWKRLGTPTETNRPGDNLSYLSGTQQEFEEAYESWKRTGRPIIMLYRKDEPIPSKMSSTEISQYKRVNNFLRECEPGGEHPVLVKSFKADEFEKTLRRELAKATSELVEANKWQLTTDLPTEIPEQEKNNRQTDFLTGIQDEPEITNWLRSVGLKGHPFRYQNAEDDPYLTTYFSRFPELQIVTANDLMHERKTWIFFGKEGSGKTALRKFLATRGRPRNPKADILCIEYDQVKFEQLLAQMEDISEFQTRFIRSIYDASAENLSGEYRNMPVAWQTTRDLQVNLANLSLWLRDGGILWVLCLIDPGKEVFTWKGSRVTTSSLLAPLLSFPEVGGVGFRYFLPAAVKDELREALAALPRNQYRLMQIEWDQHALRNLIGKRMTTLSLDQTAPYRSLGELCENDKNLSSLVDAEIASLAQGNPRGAIWLANRLIEMHCQGSAPARQISAETWDNVRLAWWARGESRILGLSEYDTFRMLGKRIFFRNHEIILQGRSNQLLRCLVQAKGGFRSKDELIQAGWPGENQAGVSEKALSEAMRRMKEELKQELKDNGIENLDWLKSVRGRGYRLRHPDTMSKTWEEEDDDETNR